MNDLNYAVDALLQAEGRKAKLRRTPKGKRKEVKRQQERSRMSIEVEPDLRDFMNQIAELEGCSPAGVLKLWMAQGIINYGKSGGLGSMFKQATDSPKWEYIITLGELQEYIDYLKVSGISL